MEKIYVVDLDESRMVNELLFSACREIERWHKVSFNGHPQLREWWYSQEENTNKDTSKKKMIFAFQRFYQKMSQKCNMKTSHEYVALPDEIKDMYQLEVKPFVVAYLHWQYYPRYEDMSSWVVEDIHYNPINKTGEFLASPGFSIWYAYSTWGAPEDCLMYNIDTKAVTSECI